MKSNDCRIVIFYNFNISCILYSFYLISHNNATPRKTQKSGDLIVCNHNGVINNTYVLCGFLYTGHYKYHKNINKFIIFSVLWIMVLA